MKKLTNKRAWAALGALALAFGLSACGGGHDAGASLGVSKPEIRFLNASATSPSMDFYLNGALLTTQSNVAYLTVGGYQTFDSGNTIAALNQAGAQTQLSSVSFASANGHRYTAVAFPGISGVSTGNDATSSLTTKEIVIDDPFDKGLLNDQARLRFLNASYNAGAVDVYIQPANTTDVSGATPNFANVAYGAAAPASAQDSIYLNGGNYTVIITATGSKTPIFNSGTVNLDNNDDLLLTSLPNTGAGSVTPNAIHVLLANGHSNTSQDLAGSAS